MPVTVRGHVIGGRLVVDEPTDLPEGTEVALVSIADDLDTALDVIPAEVAFTAIRDVRARPAGTSMTSLEALRRDRGLR